MVLYERLMELDTKLELLQISVQDGVGVSAKYFYDKISQYKQYVEILNELIFSISTSTIYKLVGQIELELIDLLNEYTLAYHDNLVYDEASRELRMLRGFKNRFGSTSEIGIFEMTQEGLVSAKDIASKFFDKSKSQSGSSLTVSMEGSRAIILEVQALVSETTFPNPKRSATGFDTNRLTMLLALLEKKLDLPFNHYDVFINISGGIKIKESSADLAVIAAIISSFRDRPISKESVFIGEVSLTGEIKDVYSIDLRLKEAQAQGIKKAIIAQKTNLKLDLKTFAVDEVSKVI
jgi:DNA repair protein RadA/Sms